MPPTQRTVASVIEHLFTNPNPDTGLPPSAAVAWVIFANGTVFYTYPTDDLPLDASAEAIEAAAIAALRELGPVVPGTSSADFNPTHLANWFPGEHVYLVTYDHPNIATVVVEGVDRLSAGLAARARRDADHAALRVEQVRRFQQ